MLEYKRYQILNLNFINELDIVILDSKLKYISDFIFRQVQEKAVFLFEMSPTKTSILYDIREFGIRKGLKKLVISSKIRIFIGENQ